MKQHKLGELPLSVKHSHNGSKDNRSTTSTIEVHVHVEVACDFASWYTKRRFNSFCSFYDNNIIELVVFAARILHDTNTTIEANVKTVSIYITEGRAVRQKGEIAGESWNYDVR